MTYYQLEPHYDRFEYLLGTSGKAGNIKGRIQPGGDPHEPPRSRHYPTPPQKELFQGAMFRRAAFALNNVRMLMLSGIGAPYDPATGQGVLCRNYTYQTISTVASFFDEDVIINPFMASGAAGTVINDFAGDNFDHGGLGFIGGAFIGATNSTGRPIQYHPVPPGTATWGKGWKQAVLKHYNHTVMIGLHGSSIAQKQNYLDLDPTYRDAWGQPLLRMTFDFPRNDLKMAEYVTAKAVEIGKAMGDDPKTSVVNRYLQSWDVPNVFVIGASAYPQNASWNPTGTLGALPYWAIDALKNQYMKNPGHLVSV